MQFRFSKMHGLGNDFVVLDAITQKISLNAQQIVSLADRHRGIGFDQLLIVDAPTTPDADFSYRIFNASGDEVEHCGNGARCFINFVHRHKLSGKNPIVVETQKGIIELFAMPHNMVRVNMGRPSFKPQDLPFNVTKAQDIYQLALGDQTVEFGAVSVGNPHAIIRVDNVNTIDINTIGAQLESHQSFPNRVNVGFLQVLDSNHAKLRVYERDVGETQACGTGACAAIAHARRMQWVANKVQIELTGGSLSIEYDNIHDNLYMTGAATHVYNGIISI